MVTFSLLRRRTAAAIGATILLLMVLLGRPGLHYAAASWRAAHQTVIGWLPWGLRLSAHGTQIDAAEGEAAEVAGVVGELDNHKAELDAEIKSLRDSQAADRSVLQRLLEELKKVPAGGVLHVGSKMFSRANVERDSQVVVARVERRAELIQQRERMLAAVETQRSRQVDLLASFRGRVDKLRLGQLEVAGLQQQVEFAKRLPGADSTGELVQAESEQRALLNELRRLVAATVSQQPDSAETPVLDALKQGDTPGMEARIEQALEKYQPARG